MDAGAPHQGVTVPTDVNQAIASAEASASATISAEQTAAQATIDQSAASAQATIDSHTADLVANVNTFNSAKVQAASALANNSDILNSAQPAALGVAAQVAASNTVFYIATGLALWFFRKHLRRLI